MKLWSPIYREGPALVAIRIEDGRYKYYGRDGLSTDYKDDADIVAFLPAKFDEAQKLAVEERWSEQKGGVGWNVYVLHKHARL